MDSLDVGNGVGPGRMPNRRSLQLVVGWMKYLGSFFRRCIFGPVDKQPPGLGKERLREPSNNVLDVLIITCNCGPPLLANVGHRDSSYTFLI